MYLRTRSAGDDRWPNALVALNALFGSLLNYCEAHHAVLMVKPRVGGFNLHLL